MSVPPEIITASTVELRRARPADSQSLFMIASDPEVMRFMDWPMPTDASSTAAHLEQVYADWESGTEYQWVVLERRTSEVAGTISFRPKGHAVDFGYFFGRNHWGKGMAFETASAVMPWFANQPGIVRIWATVDAENVRSRRLLERLGLQLEGVMRSGTVRPNIGPLPRDTAIYARINSGP